MKINIHSITSKIAVNTTFTFIIIFVFISISLFSKISKQNNEAFDSKTTKIVELTDTSLESYFTSLKTSAELFSNLDKIREDDESITSYVNLTSESGKIPMDPAKFSSYETEVYKLLKHFVTAKDDFIGIAIALESNGAFVRYPEEPRSNNYDGRTRSWYKNAKNDNGAVHFSDAYQASGGYCAIVVSRYFKSLSGKDRGVVTIDANLDYINQLIGDSKKSTDSSQKFILVDNTGTILADQLNPDNFFKKINEIGIKGFENFESGKEITFSEKLSDGKKYQIKVIKSKNSYVPLNYIAVTSYDSLNAGNYAIRRILIVYLAISIILTIIISAILGKYISRPLAETTNVLKNISEGDGDLTLRLPVNGKDETSNLSSYFNLTIEKIAASMRAIISDSNSMQNIGNSLSNKMEETAESLNCMSASINDIKGLISNQTEYVQESSATVTQISNNIKKLSKDIDTQSCNVAQSSSAIEEMVANIRSITTILGDNSKSVEELTQSADKGRAVINQTVEITNQISAKSEGLMDASRVIQNIASQTNLLAMNAAIEAAHAGEKGKGFSVVASEIRKLAEDSNTQGKKITEALGSLKEEITQIIQSAAEIQNQFNVIFENTKKVSEQGKAIDSAMKEQAAGGQQVLVAIHEINEITTNVKDGASEMEKGGQTILTQMNNLSSLTNEINNNMNTMSDNVSNINNAVQKINDITGENKNSIDSVNAELKKFKV